MSLATIENPVTSATCKSCTPPVVDALVDTYAQFPFTLVSGTGARVRDTQGREYWDLYGGHAVALLGHAHPAIAAAMHEQALKLTFYSNVVPLEIRTRAANALADFAAEVIERPRVFFCNSGAEANENALKLAVQQTGRARIAALAGGFHGRTLFALSATSTEKLRQPYAPLLAPVTRLRPNVLEDLAQLDDRVAAVIAEPILSMAGVIELTPEYLQALRQRCDAVGALLIYDEVQTGMGRLGRPLAAGEFGVQPDLITLAKGVGNGIPIGAVLLSAAVAQRVQQGDLGTTFGGGPVPCAALLAVLDTMKREQIVAQAAAFGAYAHKTLCVGPVTGVIGRGCLLGLQTTPPAKTVQQALLSRGFVTGTSGDPHVLRLLPPLVTPTVALDELAAALREIGG